MANLAIYNLAKASGVGQTAARLVSAECELVNVFKISSDRITQDVRVIASSGPTILHNPLSLALYRGNSSEK